MENQTENTPTPQVENTPTPQVENTTTPQVENTPTPQVENTTTPPAKTVYPWIIVGQPSHLLGSRQGGFWLFYNPDTKQWSANGNTLAIDNTVDLICERTTKLVNESNFTFFKVTATDISKAAFLSPSTTPNSFVGYNCKVDTYRRESFDFGTPPTTSNLESTD